MGPFIWNLPAILVKLCKFVKTCWRSINFCTRIFSPFADNSIGHRDCRFFNRRSIAYWYRGHQKYLLWSTLHSQFMLINEGPPPFLPIFSITFRKGDVSIYYDGEDDEEIVVIQFRDFRRGNDVSYFISVPYPFRFKFPKYWWTWRRNYVSNMASTSPLDTLHIAAWSHVWFKEILLCIGVGYRVVWSYRTFTKKSPLGCELSGRPLAFPGLIA